MMLAIVFSGAANYGAMQAGALAVLFEQGIQPQMLVGSSAGALNAIFMAADPSREQAEHLSEMWRAAGPDEVGVPKPFIALRRIVQQKDGLIDSHQLARFLEKRLPPAATTFAELEQLRGIKTFVASVEIDTGVLRVFGDDPGDRLLDAAMASSAVPPYFPPWEVDGRRYLDGGVYAKLPLCVAIERGATQILALDVTYPMGGAAGAHGVMGVSGYSLSLMIQAQTSYEIAWAKMAGIPLRVLSLETPSEVPFWDYTKADILIERGKTIATHELKTNPWRETGTVERMFKRLLRPRLRNPLIYECSRADSLASVKDKPLNKGD